MVPLRGLEPLFACNEGEPFNICLAERGDEIHSFLEQDGHKLKDSPVLETGEEIWMKSPELSSGFQNIILMLQR